MIKLEITPYERSILDTAIKYYINSSKVDKDIPSFAKALLEENIKILEDISERMY